MKYLGATLMGLLLSAPAFAEDEAAELREAVTCFPSKNITKFVSKFQDMDADKRDVVDMVFSAKFDVNDGGVLPERIFIRDNGAEQNFTLTPDGTCLLYTSPSPRDRQKSRMPSSA